MASPHHLRSAGRLVLALVLVGCGASPSTPVPSPSGSQLGPASLAPAPESTAPGPTQTVQASGGSGASAAPGMAGSPAPTALGGRLQATITDISKPCAMVATNAYVWITSYAGSVVAIDPTTDAVAKRYPIAGQPCGIGVDNRGALWIADLGTGRILALDPATGSVHRSVSAGGLDLWDLKVRGDDVWVVDRDARRLLRIDATTAMIKAQVAIGPSGAGLAVLRDRVWLADNIDDTLRAIDPNSNRVVAAVRSPSAAPSWFADDGVSTILVAAKTGGTVARLDSTAATLGPEIPGWSQPLDGTVLGGMAWVPDGSAAAVRVLDVSSGTLTASWSLPAAIRPFVAEAAFGSIWVLDASGHNVWRIQP